MLDQRIAFDTLVRRYYAEVVNVWPNPSAQAALGELLSSHVVFHPPNDVAGQVGVDRHTAFLNWHHGAFPDQHFLVEDVVGAGDRAACRWTLAATHRGPVLGVEATGQHIEVVGIDFFHISWERIAQFWRSLDVRGAPEAAGVAEHLEACKS